MLDYVKCVFYINWYDTISLLLVFIVDYISYFSFFNHFSNVEPALHTWNKFYFVVVYNSDYMLLDLICSYFGEDFYIYVHDDNDL